MEWEQNPSPWIERLSLWVFYIVITEASHARKFQYFSGTIYSQLNAHLKGLNTNI